MFCKSTVLLFLYQSMQVKWLPGNLLRTAICRWIKLTSLVITYKIKWIITEKRKTNVDKRGITK